MNVIERFYSYVDKNGPIPSHRSDLGPCWEWKAAKGGGNYGSFWLNGRQIPAHVFSYTNARGVIPQGLELDHLCRNRPCINPGHLEAVTHRENNLRGISPSSKNARAESCIHGHAFTPENTYRIGNRRQCRACLVRVKRTRRKRQDVREQERAYDRERAQRPEVAARRRELRNQRYRQDISFRERAKQRARDSYNIRRSGND